MTFDAFMDRLTQTVDRSSLGRALQMLKAERFQLFADSAGDHLVGIVRGQSDPRRIYSCRLDADGSYGCCTQKLNRCGGLRAGPCKHLLVLVVGLAKGGRVDLDAVGRWVAASRLRRPDLDRDLLSETLLRFKGVEAGEVDWRPAETIPEDFYAL
jgi:hypothetical protein